MICRYKVKYILIEWFITQGFQDFLYIIFLVQMREIII